ncbi:MAG: hypothetical protein ACPG4U_04825 [Pseudomonadales bacterium]
MRILSSEVAYNSQHSEHRQESYNRSVNAETERRTFEGPLQGQNARIDVVDISYNARITSAQYSGAQSQSQILQNGETTKLQREQNTTSIIQQTIGAHGSIVNLTLEETDVPALLEPVGTTAYKSVEQLELKSHERTELEVTNQAVSSDERSRLEIKEQRVLVEREKLHVGTQGRVTTADGREIDFMLSLEMSRDFKLEQSLRIEHSKRELIDPLVINLHGGAAGLTSTSFSFDLDADGQRENISFAASGSGFLALDINEDGVINDGSELFGTGQLEGFSDLARHDSDGNLWIDENDPVFDKLKVWTRDENGADRLLSLKDAGVGAIYLGSSPSSFDLTDSENNLLGQVKRSGVFLTEDGQAASIQSLDLAVHSRDDTVTSNIQALESQSAQWQEQAQAESTAQAFDLWGEPIGAPRLADSERSDGPPSLLDLLFPEPGSALAQRRETRELSTNESRGLFDNSDTDLDESGDPNFIYELDKSEMDIMQRLNEKDELKLGEEKDKYQHLRTIVENLQKDFVARREEARQEEVRAEPNVLRSS